jgi:hypothetical protein
LVRCARAQPVNPALFSDRGQLVWLSAALSLIEADSPQQGKWPGSSFEARIFGFKKGEGAEMGFIELIVTVCSLVHPGVCDDRHLQFVSQESLRACVANAETYMAKWAGEHPDVRIVKWHCAYPDQEQHSL